MPTRRKSRHSAQTQRFARMKRTALFEKLEDRAAPGSMLISLPGGILSILPDVTPELSYSVPESDERLARRSRAPSSSHRGEPELELPSLPRLAIAASSHLARSAQLALRPNRGPFATEFETPASARRETTPPRPSDLWPLDAEEQDAVRNDTRQSTPLLVTPNSSGSGESGSSSSFAGAGLSGAFNASGSTVPLASAGDAGSSAPYAGEPAADSTASNSDSPTEELQHRGTEETESEPAPLMASGAASAHRSATTDTTPSSPQAAPANAMPSPAPVTFRSFPPDLASGGWQVIESGGSSPGAGAVTVVDGNAVLCEGNSFLVTLSYTFTVPENPGDLAFGYTDLQFDTTDPNAIKDAFEVALVDQDGYSIVPTFNPSRDAYFNLSEGVPAALGTGVTHDGQSVTVSLADVPAGLDATLIFRLVNNDADTDSCVTITGAGIPGVDEPGDDQPPTVTVSLVNDTAPEGPGTELFRSDGLTNDATVSGTVADDFGVTRLESRIDSGPWLDITGALQAGQYTYAPGVLQPGLRTITIRATDTVGQTGQSLLDLTVNSPPTADAGGDRTVVENTTVPFDAAGSSDAEGPLFAYRWTFEDGSTDTGPTTSRHYPQDGVFPVQLTVTDTAGSTHTDTIHVTVQNLAPVVDPLLGLAAFEGQTVSLSAAFTDAGIFDTHTAEIDWGDGTTGPATVSSADGQGTVWAQHTYADNGVYPIMLTVTDDAGDAATAATTATITNVAPVMQAALSFEAVLIENRYHVGAVITGTFTDPGFDHPPAGTEESFTVRIDWGDGTIEQTGTGSDQDDRCLSPFAQTCTLDVVQGGPGVLTTGDFTVRHSYTSGGIYDVVVTVCDDDGGCDGQTFHYGVMLIDIKPAVRESGGSGYDATLPEGLIPVVMFGASTLDATQIAPSSVRFFPGAAPEWDTRLNLVDAPPQDGLTDAVAHFSTWDARIEPTDSVGWVIGQLTDGTPLLGADVIGVNPASARIPFAVANLPDWLRFGTPWIADANTNDAEGEASASLAQVLGSDGPGLEGKKIDGKKMEESVIPTHHFFAPNFFASESSASILLPQAEGESSAIYGPNPTDPLDVNNDGLTTPLDALLVITAINAAPRPSVLSASAAAATGPTLYLDVTGDGRVTPLDVLCVINGLNQLALEAPPSTPPHEPALSIITPGEQLEYAAGQILVISGNATATTAAGPSGTPLSNRIVAVLVNGTAVDALDAGGNFFMQVDVLPGENVFEVTAIDAYNQTASATVTIFGDQTPGGNVDLLFDVSPSFAPLYARTSFDERNDALFAELAIHNVGQYPADNPFYVGVRNISDPRVTVRDFAGTTRDGLPYYDFSPAVPGRSLDPESITGFVNAVFLNPNRIPFTYEMVFLAKPNSPPTFTSVPVIETHAGRSYDYEAQATDPDGDPLTYAILAAPRTMSIHPSTGQLTWIPAESDLGVHPIILQVEDGRGGRAEQRYFLSVTETPPNRPPFFTSVPVTTAKARSIERSGKLVVANDEWTISNSGFASAPVDTAQFVENIANWFTGGESGRFLVYSNNVGLTGSSLAQTMESLGHSWMVTTGVEFTPSTLAEYDAVFVGGYTADNSVLIDYLDQGGSIYLFLGSGSTGMFGLHPDREAAAWSMLLAHCGLEADSSEYNGIRGVIPIDPSPHPIFADISALYQDNGQTIYDLDPTDSHGTLVAVKDGHGLYAIYDTGFARGIGGYEYRSTALDPDGDVIAYDLSVKPDGMWIDPRAGVIRWFPSVEQLGSHAVIVEASDGRGGVDQQSYVVEVMPEAGNRPPVIVSEPIVVALPGQTYEYQVEAFDSDGDELAFFHEQMPPGMSFDRQSGILLWTPTQNEIGDHPVTVGVSDGRGGEDTQTYLLKVLSGTGYSIRGTIYDDLNANGIRDSELTGGDAPLITFVIDTSGSMEFSVPGANVGDRNGDGMSNRRMDVTIYALELLHQYLVDIGLPEDTKLALIDFSGSVRTNDMDVVAAGLQRATTLIGDTNSNGIPDFIDAIRRLRTPWFDGTNYAVALGRAANDITAIGIPPDGARVIFVSDGEPNRGGSGATQAQALRNMEVTLRAFGVGDVSRLNALKVLDTNAYWFVETDDLYDAFSGVSGTIVEYFESGLENRTAYVDLNGNQCFDSGEPFGVSNAEGLYVIDDVPVSDPVAVRQVVPAGWRETEPWEGQHAVQAESEQVIRGKDFGSNKLEDGSENRRPIFDSVPVPTAAVSQLYRYDANAIDIDNDELVFSLVAKPDGMTVHPDWGVVVWHPTRDQVGAHQVVLRVRDDRGGVDLQSFTITVAAPNTPPVVTSTPPSIAVVDMPLVYQVLAQDAEGDAISFNLENAPAGMVVDAETGRLTWTPTADQLDVHTLTVVASDARGGVATQGMTIEVVATAPNDPPVIHSQPRLRARVTQPYVYLIEAHDPNGDPLSFHLDAGPAGMTVDEGGVVRWTPPAETLETTSPVAIRVEDGRGGVATQQFNIQVVSQDANQPPRVVSTPLLSAVIGRTYRYDAAAEDPDGDPVVWNLVAAPTGMAIDPWRGTIRWTPAADQTGAQSVTVRVQDVFGAAGTQSFTIDVRAVNRPPSIQSVPPVAANPGELYVYAVRATDPDGDPLSFRLAVQPDGMTIDERTGLIRWTPDVPVPSQHTVQIVVEDGSGGIGSQTYTLDVGQQAVNRPPIINSIPVYQAAEGALYRYQVAARDPEGGTVRFELGAAPAGMTVEATTGLISWPNAQSGEHTVTVVALDDQDARATQSYLLGVQPNQAPVIRAIADQSVLAGRPFAYDVWASDPDGSLFDLTFELAESPAGMTIDSRGRILWTTTDGDGAFSPFTVRPVVTDPLGASAETSFTISVLPDTEAPRVELAVSTNLAQQGDTVRVQVRATDNRGVASITLMIGGAPLPLSPINGYAETTITMDTSGLIDLVAVAADAAGNQGSSAPWQVRVFDPTDQTWPQVSILALQQLELVDGQPEYRTLAREGDRITEPVTYLANLYATVDDDSLEFWRVDYAKTSEVDLSALHQADPDYRVIAEGTSPFLDANTPIAVFDPTRLSNDAYVIRVLARDVNGRISTKGLLVGVSGDAKLGNFRLDFTDLSVPLAGIPINITRTYDTLNAGTEGDFGYGWSMAITAADIAETTAPGAEMQPGDRVYLTSPEGKRIGFTYDPELFHAVTSIGYFGTTYTPRFKPDPGVRETLTVRDGSYTRGGVFGSIGAALGNAWNPSQYVLTTADGTVYDYIQGEGLKKITDANNNVITFTPTAIKHSSGDQIDLIRDARGRIKQIIAPGPTPGDDPIRLNYTYNAARDLAGFTNQMGETVTYGYSTDPRYPHFLTSITDSRGIVVFEAQFDDDGRLIGSTDALGGSVRQQFEPGSFTGTITDARDNVTTLLHNQRGNVLEETDPLGQTTYYEYTDPRFPDLETKITDRNGMVELRQYDAAGNLKSVTRAAGTAQEVTTEYTYDSRSNLTSIRQAGQSPTVFTYDPAGDLTTITNAIGDVATATYDSQGRQASFTDFNGHTTTYDYTSGCSSCGSPGVITHPDGTYEITQYNLYGQPTRQNVFEADGTLVQSSTTAYDRQGRTMREVFGTGAERTEKRYVYSGNLLDWEIVVHPDSVDASGRLLESPATPVDQRKSSITDYEYDAAGQIIRQIDAEGGVVEFRYDANGNRILLQDPVGNITTWVYDALDRMVEERDPFYWVEYVAADPTPFEGLVGDAFLAEIVSANNEPSGASADVNQGAPHVRVFGYDGEGNQTRIIDRNDRRREFDHDPLGRLIEERWYDPDGTLVRTVNSTYDQRGNLQSITDPDSSYTYTYDVLNRVTTIDNAGSPDMPHVVLSYAYDAMGNVTRTSDNFGVTVESQYDSRNRLSQRLWYGGDVDPARVDFFYNAIGREERVDRYADLEGVNRVASTDSTYYTTGATRQITHRNATDEVIAAYEYQYDFAGLLTGEDRYGQSYSNNDWRADYAYDRTGQLLSATYTGADVIPEQVDEHYRYDANGNRTESYLHGTGYRTGPANQLLTDGTYDYQYDAEGNMVKKTEIATGQVTTFEYDHRNLMVQATIWSSDPTNGGVILHEEQYRYDAHNRRTLILIDPDGAGADAAEATSIIHDGYNAWADFGRTKPAEARYLYGYRIDQLLASYRPHEDTAWDLRDRFGTTRIVVGSVGACLDHIEYGAFGNVLTEPNTAGNSPIRFTGREYSPALGLFNFRARSYDATLGRFVTRDPLGVARWDTNLFVYARNSPLYWVDPMGTTVINYSISLTISIPTISILKFIGMVSLPFVFVAIIEALGDIDLTVLEDDAIQQAESGKVFTPGQQETVEKAKRAKRRGVSKGEAEALIEEARQRGLPARGHYDGHPGRKHGSKPHIHIGPINHIPVI